MSSQHEIADAKKRNKRGSVNNERRLAALGGKSESKGEADWGTIAPAWVHAVVVAATLKGAAISFSLARNGGAYGVCVLLDGDRQQLWFNQDADVEAELERVFHFFESL